MSTLNFTALQNYFGRLIVRPKIEPIIDGVDLNFFTPGIEFFAVFDPKLSFDESEALLGVLLEKDRKRLSYAQLNCASAAKVEKS